MADIHVKSVHQQKKIGCENKLESAIKACDVNIVLDSKHTG